MDIKSDGGYVVAPSGKHESGVQYGFLKGLDTPLAELPSMDSLRGKTMSLDKYALLEQGSKEGRRNDTLAKLVGHG